MTDLKGELKTSLLKEFFDSDFLKATSKIIKKFVYVVGVTVMLMKIQSFII